MHVLFQKVFGKHVNMSLKACVQCQCPAKVALVTRCSSHDRRACKATATRPAVSRRDALSGFSLLTAWSAALISFTVLSCCPSTLKVQLQTVSRSSTHVSQMPLCTQAPCWASHWRRYQQQRRHSGARGAAATNVQQSCGLSRACRRGREPDAGRCRSRVQRQSGLPVPREGLLRGDARRVRQCPAAPAADRRVWRPTENNIGCVLISAASSSL